MEQKSDGVVQSQEFCLDFVFHAAQTIASIVSDQLFKVSLLKCFKSRFLKFKNFKLNQILIDRFLRKETIYYFANLTQSIINERKKNKGTYLKMF